MRYSEPMPAAMLYAAVQGTVGGNAFLSAVGAAAAAAGLTQGPWTAAQVVVPVELAPTYGQAGASPPPLTDAQVVAVRRLGGDPLTAAQRAALATAVGFTQNGMGLYGTAGPFAGVLVNVDASAPAPPSVVISAFKQVLLGTLTSAARGHMTSSVFNALHAFNVSTAPWGSTPIGDRGVPENPAYSEEGAGSSAGMLIGIAAVAGLAYLSARGSDKRPAPTLGNCPDLRRVERTMMTRARRGGGLGGLGSVSKNNHLLVVEGHGIGTQVTEAFASERAARTAADQLRIFRDALGAKATIRVAHKLRGSGQVRRMSRGEVLQLLKQTVV